VQSLNGFSGDVQMTLSGMPSGVTANPLSPFSVQSGGSATLLLGASATASTGSAAISVQASSGALTHSSSIALTVQSGTATVVSRTTYTRTDAQSALDDPIGEPHHRHMVYDSANRHLFIANRARNRVEILSTQDGSPVGSVDVAGASSVDISPDSKIIWVGSLTEQIAAIDTGSLQRTNTFQLSGIVPIPNTVFDRPEEVVALSGGRLLVRLRQANAAESLLALLDPSSNSLTNLTPLAPQAFQNGVGEMARSADHTRVLVTSNDNSGTTLVLDGNGAVLTAAKSIGSGALTYAAANSDGSRFAAVLANGSSQQLLLLDSSLNMISASSVTAARGLVFSRNGQSLDIAANQNGVPLLSVLAAADLHSLGTAPDAEIQGISSEVEEVDETAFVFGLNNRGVSFVDASQAGMITGSVPALASAPSLTPTSGLNIGGTTVTLSGQNFASNPVLHIGGQVASVTSSNAAQIQANSPPSTTNGAVNVTAYFSNGAIALAPDAFSYGAQVLEILPNAGNSAGGDSIAIYGYGFGEDASKVAVKFGSATATIQKVEDVSALTASLGLDATYPFPLQRIMVTVPAGPVGKADLSISAPSGSTTAKLSFQYLQSDQVFAKAGFYKFILYDQKRQWIYLSNIDHLDVFDLGQGIYRSGILPPGGPPPNALIRQAALTPDATQLLVADFGAQSIYLIDPDTASGSSVNVGGVAGDANSGPVRVAATSAQSVFVGLAGFGGNTSGCSTCLQQMNLSASPVTVQTAPQPQVASLTGSPLVDASSDGSEAFFGFASAPGQPMAGWSAATPGQFLTAQTNIPSPDIAVAPDGSFLASRNANVVEIRDAILALQSVSAESELEGIPQRSDVPGIALHSSGALIYVPFLTGPAPVSAPFTGLHGGVDILDTHTGRLRLRVILPEPLAMLSADVDGLHGRFLAIDENGQRIFALTASGLTVVQLARVPLGIGTITPASGPSSGGATLTIRGSGFETGASATIGGKAVAVTFVDMNTLKIAAPALNAGKYRITVTNSDGETTSLDASFTAN
jgi:IPT/TIG domain-containing protein